MSPASNCVKVQRCSASGPGTSLLAGRCLDALEFSSSPFPFSQQTMENRTPPSTNFGLFPPLHSAEHWACPAKRRHEVRISCSEAHFIQTARCSHILHVHTVLCSGWVTLLSPPSCPLLPPAAKNNNFSPRPSKDSHPQLVLCQLIQKSV